MHYSGEQGIKKYLSSDSCHTDQILGRSGPGEDKCSQEIRGF